MYFRSIILFYCLPTAGIGQIGMNKYWLSSVFAEPRLLVLQ